ncbi:hypothetical protein RR48_02332 [Papilio machaon]|uniref:Uncharacterized protein n=1 Tax=Papilio machaon TaxID=76193 RepID=A0A0N0PEF3_PAPMA|nr:hypothetical protein RR48_02332 [Papilio machaon]
MTGVEQMPDISIPKATVTSRRKREYHQDFKRITKCQTQTNRENN